MLSALSIRNIVLIEAVDLDFAGGLSVLTGETGAGKSIILDSLSLALGGRADRALVRAGADAASASASFEIVPGHPALALLAEAGIEVGEGEPLILRRSVSAAGQSRAFVNDAPVGVQLLKSVGETLVEIHGQHDERGLLDPRGHLDLLDGFGGLGAKRAETSDAYRAWRAAEEEVRAFEERRAALAAEEEFLDHAAAELAKLAPEPGEEAALTAERTLRLNASKIADDVGDALEALAGGDGLIARAGAALRRLERAGEEARTVTEAAASALERTLIEAGEAESALNDALDALRHDPARLSVVEDRLFALKAAARKYRVTADDLPAKQEQVSRDLAAIRTGEREQKDLASAAQAAKAAFLARATELSTHRRAAAEKLDVAVNRELAPLRLATAEFSTGIETLPPEKAGSTGLDKVEFRVRTNVGTAPGPLKDIASGGELARFVLALKVVLARAGSAGTLIFDEVDRGIGGAVADAVGERLARLASAAQVLVVTHSPQVAARGQHHFQVTKSERKRGTSVALDVLAGNERREEIARMLSGAKISDEARAAAERLLSGAQEPPKRGAKKKVASA
jgi:DNA repair protein RecN (Recombination protein N)